MLRFNMISTTKCLFRTSNIPLGRMVASRIRPTNLAKILTSNNVHTTQNTAFSTFTVKNSSFLTSSQQRCLSTQANALPNVSSVLFFFNSYFTIHFLRRKLFSQHYKRLSDHRMLALHSKSVNSMAKMKAITGE